MLHDSNTGNSDNCDNVSIRIRFPLACREDDVVTELQYRIPNMCRPAQACRTLRTLILPSDPEGESMKTRPTLSTKTFRRSLLSAAILGAGFAGAAHAADDQSLTCNGSTLYGTVYLDEPYQNHGTPVTQDVYPGLAYLVQPYSNKSITSTGPN